MPPFSILLKPSVEKDLRKLPASVVRQVFEAFERLAEDPAVPPDRKLSGTERTWRHRIGDYRIVYELDLANRTVIIHYVRHRREVYRRL
ncbi:type II toxin-antitoxin system RelE/ParE family toxin [Oryzomonas sagensis]|uniref:Type II toxin-antitoxin system RelE/ParE family toxin n=1 Tax=Oryzomonas sagensis TaxID=2603857 RepID=A0ABQ6TP57_9BACT|nr:type II toxin-antitoxin system RelE/ParE family toxin [Oryzomonas sagensis]KAB0670374.1 type II toxin-antitoxin system RelE/ParE family toxin [Oryzomonas sagensis]